MTTPDLTVVTPTPTARAARPVAKVSLPKPVALAEKVSFGRLVRVEARKLFDTRSGQWLLGITLASLVGIGGVVAAAYRTLSRVIGTNWMAPATLISLVMAVLVPVLVIMLFTSEWSQRTSLATFSMEPRRGRVLAAKAVVALLVAVGCWVVEYAVTAASVAIGGAAHGVDVSWSTDWKIVAGMLAAFLLTMAMAAGFGLLFMNTAAAIVLYMALPMATGMLALAGSKVQAVLHWIDVGDASVPLSTGQWAKYDAWQLLVASLIWVVTPIAVGVSRQFRTEAK